MLIFDIQFVHRTISPSLYSFLSRYLFIDFSVGNYHLSHQTFIVIIVYQIFGISAVVEYLATIVESINFQRFNSKSQVFTLQLCYDKMHDQKKFFWGFNPAKMHCEFAYTTNAFQDESWDLLNSKGYEFDRIKSSLLWSLNSFIIISSPWLWD